MHEGRVEFEGEGDRRVLILGDARLAAPRSRLSWLKRRQLMGTEMATIEDFDFPLHLVEFKKRVVNDQHSRRRATQFLKEREDEYGRLTEADAIGIFFQTSVKAHVATGLYLRAKPELRLALRK